MQFRPELALIAGSRDARCSPDPVMRVPILVHHSAAGLGEHIAVLHEALKDLVAARDRTPANSERIAETGVALTRGFGGSGRPHE